MYICHCRGVTDREIRAAIDDGASTIADLSRMCDAGGRCRGCWPALTELLSQSDHALDDRLVSMLRS